MAAPVLKNLRAQAQTESFPGTEESALKEIAATVLPETLSRQGTDKVAVDFIRWVHDYKQGAEMQNGYGVTRVRSVPPGPAAKYLDQLRELSSSVLVDPDTPRRRTLLAERLKADGIHDLPGLPLTGNIVVDLMAFYFNSSAANDLLYEAAIGRDTCRGLEHSSAQPAPFKLGSN
ncbi:MAG TPA: hypothetical protein VH302_00260 [Bryobacteraceae bacterium]|nr:hypothetical protein [Bryobacteraceae bacterium]